jgi:Protein of unknown function (DUF1573)
MPRPVLTLLVASVVAAAAAAQPVVVANGAAAFIPEKEKDFGVTALGPVLVHYFPITNTSKQKVTMTAPRIGCGCVSATLMKGELAPGETTYLVAYMNTAKIPSAQLNTNKGVTVSVPFTSPTYEEVVLTVRCLARTDLIWSTQDGVSFGTVTKGKTATATMEVTLYNQPGWEVKEVKSNGAYVKAEAKLTKRAGNSVTYEISCKLDEKCPAGSWMSDLTLTTNAPGIEKMRVPVTVNVEPKIAATSADVGAVAVGGLKSVDVTLSGKEPFKVLEVKGAEGGVSVTPKTDGARLQHTLKVDVKADAAGALKKDITIKTDNKDQPEVIVQVSATVTK